MKSGFFFRIPSANIIGKPRRTIHIDRIALAGRRCSVFDGTRRVYYELLKPGETVNTKRYQQQLIDLFKKRPEYQKRQHKAIFLHDNAPSYMAKPVRDTLEALSWEILPHAATHQTWLLPITTCLHRWVTHLLNNALVRTKM